MVSDCVWNVKYYIPSLRVYCLQHVQTIWDACCGDGSAEYPGKELAFLCNLAEEEISQETNCILVTPGLGFEVYTAESYCRSQHGTNLAVLVSKADIDELTTMCAPDTCMIGL